MCVYVRTCMRNPIKCSEMYLYGQPSGAGQKTPQIFVSESSNNKWRHIRSKSVKNRRGARFCRVEKWSFGRVWFFRICEPTLSSYFIMMISASCRDIVSTSWAKILAREERLLSFCRGKTESEVPYHGGYFTPWKRVAFQLLALVVPDASITSCYIAYDLHNIMDEILVIIVCSVKCWE